MKGGRDPVDLEEGDRKVPSPWTPFEREEPLEDPGLADPSGAYQREVPFRGPGAYVASEHPQLGAFRLAVDEEHPWGP